MHYADRMTMIFDQKNLLVVSKHVVGLIVIVDQHTLVKCLRVNFLISKFVSLQLLCMTNRIDQV